MGSCAFWTRVGGVIAPQIIILVRHLYIHLSSYLHLGMNEVLKFIYGESKR